VICFNRVFELPLPRTEKRPKMHFFFFNVRTLFRTGADVRCFPVLFFQPPRGGARGGVRNEKTLRRAPFFFVRFSAFLGKGSSKTREAN
jgi:hypothetical protein